MSHTNRVCTKCGAPMSDSQTFCSNCGNNSTVNYSMQNQYAPVVQNQSSKREKDIILYVIIAILIVLLTVIVFMAYSIANKETKTVTQIIERPQQTTTTTGGNSQNEVQYIVVDGDYLYPSDRQLITTAYLSTLTKDTVALIRNEIYARHGYIFNNETYRNYFSSKSWYYPNPYFDESMFNEIEKANKETIVNYEQSRGWR